MNTEISRVQANAGIAQKWYMQTFEIQRRHARESKGVARESPGKLSSALGVLGG